MHSEQCLRLRLRPLTAFGSAPKGDTWFGQLCWTLRHRLGEPSLMERLTGYTSGQPFAVVSDAFPAGYLPRPALPVAYYRLPEDMDRKQFKRRTWVPWQALRHPLDQWLQQTAGEELAEPEGWQRPQPHNSIDRRTGTTGGGFAPYTMGQIWYGAESRLDVYVVLDSGRLTMDELTACFEMIGQFGFGRDASIGLGKFALEHCETMDWPRPAQTNACLTLAPCAPQGLPLEPARCFYKVFTRFGRHGDQAVHTGKPFKAPVLLADTGAVFSPAVAAGYFGQGVGSAGRLSRAIDATVHQGYAPVVSVNLPVLGGEG